MLVLAVAASSGTAITEAAAKAGTSPTPKVTASENSGTYQAVGKPMKSQREQIAAARAKLVAGRAAAAHGAHPNAGASFALAPTDPLPACVGGTTIYDYPRVYGSDHTTHCYAVGPGGTSIKLTGPTNQTLWPNSTIHLGTVGAYGGWPNQAAYLLSWNNLWDPWPLMRGSNDTVANDYVAQELWVIAPSIDDSGCYDASQAYLYGRFVADCALHFGKGPYYGTAPGATIPYTVFVGSTVAGGRYNSPFPSNCGGTCALNFSYYSGAYAELPMFVEPSPYAGFSQSITGGTVKFTDTTLSDLQITNWTWNFGDGATGSGANPIHNYAHPGTYHVTMNMQTIDGQTDTSVNDINITAQYNLSGTVKDLSNNGVKTTLTLTKNSDLSKQTILVGDDGSYSTAVDSGNYKLKPDASAPAGMFTPASKNLSINADTVANFKVNGRRINVAVTNNDGKPVPNVSVPVTGGSVLGAITTDATGKGYVEAAAGSYTLTPTDPHPGQGYQFVPPSANVTVAGADVSQAFQYKAAVWVTSVTPNVGPAGGGTTVTVTGGGFEQGGTASVSAVKFASGPGHAVTGKNVNVISDSELTVVTPKAAPLLGAQDTSVETDTLVTSGPYTSGVTTDDVYVFGNVPSVTNVALNNGRINGGNKIVLTGKHFTGATGVTMEPLGTAPILKVKTFTVDSDTQITVTVPGMDLTNLAANNPVVTDVRVKTPDGTSPTGYADHYSYRGPNIVQLGDSIAAGEGINYGFTYDNTTGRWTKGVDNPVWAGDYQLCHQSASAFSTFVGYGTYGKVTNFACTGGTYAHGVAGDQPDESAPAQFGYYPGGPINAKYDAAEPDVVLISMGADDIRFADIITNCIASKVKYFTSGDHNDLTCIPTKPGAATKIDFWQNLAPVGFHLTELIREIEQRGIDGPNHVAPKIVVQDYYNPFPDPGASCPDNAMFDNEQIPYISSLVDTLDAKIARTVNGIARTDKNVKFVELHDAYINNRWCSSDPWAYGISIITSNLDVSNQAPFHPTPTGQQVIASYVTPAVQQLLTPST
jgi:lysophospholipase L1-like esterase